MYQLPLLESVANFFQKRNSAGFFLCSTHSTHFLPRLNWKWHKPLERSLPGGCGSEHGEGRVPPSLPSGSPHGIPALGAPSGHRSRRPRAPFLPSLPPARPPAPRAARTHPPSPHFTSHYPHSPPPPLPAPRAARTHRRCPAAEQGRRCPSAAAPRCPNARSAERAAPPRMRPAARGRP